MRKQYYISTRTQQRWNQKMFSLLRPQLNSGNFIKWKLKYVAPPEQSMYKWHVHQGCQISYFQTKNPNLGKFWSVLQWQMLVYFMAIWSTLQLYGIFCGRLVYWIVIWYIFSRFGMFCQEKSGSPDVHVHFDFSSLTSFTFER
jgi:hypothetical protein